MSHKHIKDLKMISELIQFPCRIALRINVILQNSQAETKNNIKNWEIIKRDFREIELRVPGSISSTEKEAGFTKAAADKLRAPEVWRKTTTTTVKNDGDCR